MYLKAVRVGVSLPLAIITTIGIIWVMQFLIATANKQLDTSDTVRFVDFVRVDREQNIERKKPKPKQPPKPEDPPPEPPAPQMDSLNPNAETMAISSVNPNTEINLDGFGISTLAAADGEYLPIVKVQPVYPRRALSRGIEGYVIVEFTVTRQGTTRDARIVEAKPQGIFDRAALLAAAKFKYKPRVVDGQPIEVPGVRNKITFEIEE